MRRCDMKTGFPKSCNLFANGRRALAKYPEVARVESQAVCRCTVCRQDFLQTSL